MADSVRKVEYFSITVPNQPAKAFGVLSTVAIAPLPASNGVGDLASELNYLHGHTSFTDVQLANGTTAFNGGKLPVGG